MKNSRWLVVVLGSLLAACGGSERGSEFSGALADSLVRVQVGFGPRVPGSEGHAEQLEWMVEWLEERADVVERHPFEHVTAQGDTLRLSNVWARFRPGESARILLLTHWDTRPVAERAEDPARRGEPIPGANDGASGTAVLLAIAERLAETPPSIGVDLLFTDGEDWGHDPSTFETDVDDMLLGARHFAESYGGRYRPLFGILLDLVGDADPAFPWEGYSVEYAPEVVRRVWGVAEELGHGDVFVERPGPAVMDDHVPLNEVGIRTIDVIDFDYAYWHTPEDTPDKVSGRTLEIVGDVVLTVIRRQGR